uniref:Uncharacterized protein n=1 Tax=Cannabis sativa TaxID=3483 RepID=A0A803NV64_CANSA
MPLIGQKSLVGPMGPIVERWYGPMVGPDAFNWVKYVHGSDARELGPMVRPDALDWANLFVGQMGPMVFWLVEIEIPSVDLVVVVKAG